MQLIYHGHSCVQITSLEHSIVIDPFLTGNPVAQTKAEDINAQYVLLTHGHSDHTADAETICRRTGANLIATFELASYYSWKGLNTVGMNIGGTFDLGFAKVKMVQAFHSSSMVLENEQKIVYMGMPGGFLITWNGLTLLHAGDTALFGDMKIIGERYSIDYAMLPVGDFFTMGPDDALVAAEWLRAKKVIPIHHGTFPPIRQDMGEFVRKLGERGMEGLALKPGEQITLVK